MKTINGFSGKTPVEIFESEGFVVVKGTTKIIRINEPLEEGIDVSTLNQDDNFEWSDPIETQNLLQEAIDFYDKII